MFTVSVQPHGKYPSEYDGDEFISEGELNYKDSAQMEYYLSQIYETDAFIGELIEQLKQLEEKTVLVLYGDHLPGLRIDEDELQGSLYQTEYVIWSNFDIQREEKDLDAFRLTSEIYDILGIDVGILPQYHIEFYGTDDYEKNLKMLEYDMLYGDKMAYGEAGAPEATELKMGQKDIAIRNVKCVNGERLYVLGQNFNEYSVIYINGKRMETHIYSHRLLSCEAGIERGDAVTVVQSGEKRDVLGGTEPFVVK